LITHKKVDAVTVGVGWTGGILAAEMTKAGMTVVGLERGRARGTEDFQSDHDELAYAVHLKLFQNAQTETQTLRHNLSERALPIRQLAVWLPGTGVGGAGIHWNGQNWRFHPSDFRHRSHYVEKYGKDFFTKIDPDMRPRDWGITYEELEPYMNRFEVMAGISGEAGVLNGKKTGKGNPFEGSRQAQYPTKPMDVSLMGNLFYDATKNLGYHPFPGPSANLSEPYVNPDGVARSHCLYCGFCERFGCEVGAKASPNVTVLPVAMATGRYELRTNSWVHRIVHENGHAKGVIYTDAAGRENFQPADIVCMTAFHFNNIRLLLLSGLGTPYDYKTETGSVGRNFAYQLGTGASMFWEEDDMDKLNLFMGAGANQMVIDDFNADNFDHSDLHFVGGGSISSGSTGNRPIQTQSVPETVTQGWGAEWKQAIKKYWRRHGSVGSQIESNAYRQHFADLDPTYNDAFGDPLLRITFDWRSNEVKTAAYIGKKCTEIAKNVKGVTSVTPGGEIAPHFDTTVYQSTHVVGGTIMGSDPKETTVNDYLQMWEAPNVFVVGANNFPQNAGYNPTGTLGGLAYRAADGIINHYIKSPGPIRS
jgi:gluconate 2-dehydrogenase alpha chain